MQYLGVDYAHFKHYPEEFNPSDFKDLQVTLVDHNVPDEKLRSHVIEIIDHHEDAEAIQCPRVMEYVGSCATLVAERLLNNKDYEMTKEKATMLLSAILADTSNLDAKRRTTDKDRSIALCLKDLVDIDTNEIYSKVNYLLCISMKQYYLIVIIQITYNIYMWESCTCDSHA